MAIKEVIAIIRPEKLHRTVEALFSAGVVESLIQKRVLGRGRQAGLRYLSRTREPGTMRFLPKQMLWFSVQDWQLELAIKTIISVNRTGVIGDGKIFVCPCEEVPATDDHKA